MDSFPQLETERLILSQLRASDIPAIVDYANHKPIADYTLNIPYPYSENDAIYWLNQAHQGFRNNTLFVFAIRQKSDQSFMAYILSNDLIGLRLVTGLQNHSGIRAT